MDLDSLQRLENGWVWICPNRLPSVAAKSEKNFVYCRIRQVRSVYIILHSIRRWATFCASTIHR